MRLLFCYVVYGCMGVHLWMNYTCDLLPTILGIWDPKAKPCQALIKEVEVIKIRILAYIINQIRHHTICTPNPIQSELFELLPLHTDGSIVIK